MFIHARSFSRFIQTARVGDEQLRKLEQDIMAGAGVAVAGTGGVKKIRWAASGRGKSGSWRVIFADYPRFGVTVLLKAFEKSGQSDLSADERNALRQVKKAIDQEMERKHAQKRIL